jgi:MoxR-like ATPase
MYFESFLPFVCEYGYLEKNKEENINVSEVFCPIVTNRSMEDLEKDSIVQLYLKNKIIKVYHIMPLGIKVFAENDLLSYYVKQKFNNELVKADVTYIDYSDIAKRIRISNGNAFVQKNNATMVHEGVITDMFVNSAANSVGVNIQNLSETGKNIFIQLPETVSLFSLFETPLGEAVDTKAQFAKFQKTKRVDVKVSKLDYIYEWLDAYFQMPEGKDMTDSEGREVVPLLLGPTGVFKSATVKTLCKKHGFRMVDFRVAFTSRLDYSGLYEMSTLGGENFSSSCPMVELVTCSDGFRAYCKLAVEKLKTALMNGYLIVRKASTGNDVAEIQQPMTKEQIDIVTTMISQYNEYIKPPVLFFDEITRNKNKGVEGVLVELLNQKRFNEMTMTGCKFVAATNLSLNTMHPELNAIYEVNTEIDVAFKNRFQPLNVYPLEVVDRWMDWGSTPQEKKPEKMNIHPLILKFLKSNPDRVYDETPVINAYASSQTGNAIIEAAATPYPNYRTWELVSEYIYTREVDKKLNRDIIKGLIFSTTTDTLLTFLSKNGYSEDIVDAKTDDVGKFLENSLDANLPALLIGPSSLGKTSRVNAYCKKVEKATGKKPVIIHINLASKDAVDIMGMPVKRSLSSYVTKGIFTDSEDESFDALSSDLTSLVKDSKTMADAGVGNTLTIRAPDTAIKARFKKAIDNKTMVILFFDECNRVTNPAIMSSMFEAISDHRIFGIDFSEDKEYVRVIAACNLGVGYTGAKGIDAALSARFSIFWKKEYDEKDAVSFKQFLSDKKEEGQIDGLLFNYLNEMPNADLLNHIKRVELRALEFSEPTTRMLFQLSKDIKNMRGSVNTTGDYKSSLFNGTILFNSTKREELANFADSLDTADINDSIAVARDLAQYVRVNSTRWEGKLKELKVNFNGEMMLSSDLLQMLEEQETELITNLNSMKPADVKDMLTFMLGIFDSLSTIDDEITTLRQNVLQSYAGVDFTQGFLPYFNENFGQSTDAEIEISMLDDISLIPIFFTRKLSKMGNLTQDLKVVEMLTLIDEFWTYWKDNPIPAQNCAAYFIEATKSLATNDNVIMLHTKLGLKQDPFLAKAESSGDTFIKDVLSIYPGKVSDVDINAIRAKMTGGSYKVAAKAKLI